jgi:transcriptional regulator with XRE-family HTH domain
MPVENIISNLKSRRSVLSITQKDLAELSGVALITIKKLESGKAKPTLETLCKLADVLGMEVKLEVKKPNN